ncbi:MAG: hypothetical protein KF764_19815 [Labilithrix sp.]|nr:hypothetical protein [Labilithrix sp.]MBX3222839.1 hypothetical protein [Labilithrix sp.]
MTAPVSSRETGLQFAVRNAVDVCAFVDRLSHDAAGEILVAREGTLARGAVFVEGGRVCWAAARGLAPRLTELLIRSSGVDAETMESNFRHCKLAGVPLGELLVARGLVRDAELRAALLQHTIESMDALCHEDASASWRPRPGGYSPRFTFTTSEVLARSLGHAHRGLAAASDRALDVFSNAPPGEWGAAFIRGGAFAAPSPIAARGFLPETAAAVLRVGKWAASALDVAATFQSEDAFLTAMEAGGSSLVAWRHDQTIIAGRVWAQGPARILNHRATLRRRARTASQD